MAFPYDPFQPYPPIHQHQQHPIHRNGEESSDVDSSQQLLMIANWTNGLAARLEELRYQLNATFYAPDYQSIQWLAWNDYLAHQFELLADGIMVHRSWLLYLQQEEEQTKTIDSPQYKYSSRLKGLNEKLNQAYIESTKERKGTRKDGYPY